MQARLSSAPLAKAALPNRSSPHQSTQPAIVCSFRLMKTGQRSSQRESYRRQTVAKGFLLSQTLSSLCTTLATSLSCRHQPCLNIESGASVCSATLDLLANATAKTTKSLITQIQAKDHLRWAALPTALSFRTVSSIRRTLRIEKKHAFM